MIEMIKTITIIRKIRMIRFDIKIEMIKTKLNKLGQRQSQTPFFSAFCFV